MAHIIWANLILYKRNTDIYHYSQMGINITRFSKKHIQKNHLIIFTRTAMQKSVNFRFSESKYARVPWAWLVNEVTDCI